MTTKLCEILLWLILYSLGSGTVCAFPEYPRTPQKNDCTFHFSQAQRCNGTEDRNDVWDQLFFLSDLSRHDGGDSRTVASSDFKDWQNIPWGMGSIPIHFIANDERHMNLHYFKDSIFFSLDYQGWPLTKEPNRKAGLNGECKSEAWTTWKDWTAFNKSEIVTPALVAYADLLAPHSMTPLLWESRGTCLEPEGTGDRLVGPCNAPNGNVDQGSLRCSPQAQSRARVRYSTCIFDCTKTA